MTPFEQLFLQDGSIMKKNSNVIVLSLFLALAPFHSFASTSADSVMSEVTDNTLIEGKVRRYNQDTQTIRFQLKSGEKITITLDWNTILVGYSSPNEIKKGHKLKIWYSNSNDSKTAVKIEKKLRVGC